MPDINDTESTSSGLITLDEANIMSFDINMLAVSQPRLPTPTPFDGSSPPFQEWASELRTFLDINGFQYIIDGHCLQGGRSHPSSSSLLWN